MPLTDRKGLGSCEPPNVRSCACLFPLGMSVALVLFFALGLISPAAYAQDSTNEQDQQNQSVAEAARQERARKHEQQKTAKHVYTAEDLKRRRILTPEDRAKVEARKNDCARKNNCGPAPAQIPPASLDADSKSAQPSLGEIARQLRKQKELEALKPKQSEPFHLPIGEPALASPVLPGHSGARPTVPPVLRPDARSSGTRASIFRRDPFAPVPTRPRVPLDGGSRPVPAIRPRTRAFAPPKILRRRTPSGLSVTPMQPPQPVPDLSSPDSLAPMLRIQPVRPSLPTKSRRAILPALSARIFSAPAPVPSLVLPRVKPTAPVAPAERLPDPPSLQPVAPTVRSSASPSQGKIIRVRPGDSLWKLARRNLGRGILWSQLLAANPAISDPNHLRIGAALVLPTKSVTSGSASAVPAARTDVLNNLTKIQVRKGDTLWTLSKSSLGRAANWRCLAAANPSISDPNRIFEGQELLVPSACAVEANTRALSSEK